MTEKVGITTPDAEYDVVVVGSGASGLMCAVQAAKNGLTVAVVEKMPTVGGGSVFTEGHAAFESDEQAKRGITVTKAEAFNRYMEYGHWYPDATIVARFVENAATTIKKLRDEQGVVYLDVMNTGPDSGELLSWHVPEGEGARVIELLEADARRRSVDIFVETPVKQIVKEGDEVTGVVAEGSDGQLVTIGAKAVVVGTGGFAGSPEMLNKYQRFNCGEQYMVMGAPGNTGDGINMMLDAGAVPCQSIGAHAGEPWMRGKTNSSHSNAAGAQPYLWVNRYGHRFVNEICGLNFSEAENVLVGLPGHLYWAILDSAAIDHLVQDGCEVGVGGKWVATGERLVNLPTELASDVAAGTVAFSADTLDELAKQIDVDPAVLRAEVAEYSGFAHEGVDRKYFKKAKYLRPVEKGPFYAIKMEPSIICTMGGVKIDDRMRVLDKDGLPIPGLYSVGNDAGGMWGDSYALTVPTSCNGFALTSGWLAADDIAERLHQPQPAAV